MQSEYKQQIIFCTFIPQHVSEGLCLYLRHLKVGLTELKRSRHTGVERIPVDISTQKRTCQSYVTFTLAWFPFQCQANLLKFHKKRKKKCELGAFPSSGWSG